MTQIFTDPAALTWQPDIQKLWRAAGSAVTEGRERQVLALAESWLMLIDAELAARAATPAAETVARLNGWRRDIEEITRGLRNATPLPPGAT